MWQRQRGAVDLFATNQKQAFFRTGAAFIGSGSHAFREDIMDELLTTGEAAEYIDATVITFMKICEQNGIEPARVEDGKRLYSKHDLEPYRTENAG